MIGIGLYVKNSIEAAKVYMKAFGLTLGYHVLNDDGSYFHSELMKDGEPFLSVVETKEKEPAFNRTVQLGITFETEDELDRAYTILIEGGYVTLEPSELPWSPYAAEVQDKYGVNWFLSLPQHHPVEE